VITDDVVMPTGATSFASKRCGSRSDCEQCLTSCSRPDHGRGPQDRLAADSRWPGRDGQLTDHMPRSWRFDGALIHHFKLVTEGIRVPAARSTWRSNRRAASSVCTWSVTRYPPLSRALSDPSFTNLQPSQRCPKAECRGLDHRGRQHRPVMAGWTMTDPNSNPTPASGERCSSGSVRHRRTQPVRG